MKLLDEVEFRKYVEENFECLYKDEENSSISQQVPDTCDSCSRDVFLRVYSETFSETNYNAQTGLPKFVNIFIECPTCRRRSFIFAVQFVDQIRIHQPIGGVRFEYKHSLYKLYRLPIVSESYINEDIPATFTSLRKTATEANSCLKNSKFLAAAILFRRAIQIVAKNVLGAKGKTLFNQLEWLKTNKNSLNIDLTEVFHENAKIIKDIGNQGAHPDDDITLHEFTKEDANGLHDLFISIIHEIFVKPEKMKALQEELKKNRKLS
jgi:hypothetical protein